MDSFIGWIGGKKLLRDQIIMRFPENIGRYVEVFGGAAWVMLRKDKHAPLEVYNDADGNLVNLFRCVKYHASELQRELEWVINARETFTACREQPGLTDIQRAARFFTLIKISYGSDRRSYGCASRPGVAATIELLSDVQARLANVVVEHKDFEDLIKVYDSPDALFYCDPPYFGTERYYDGSFAKTDHERLRRVLDKIEGRFILSYNDCAEIRGLYNGYTVEAVSRSNNLTSGRYYEVLIRNY